MDGVSKIILGKNLSKEDLDIINYYRKKEFNSDFDIAPALDNDDWEKPYILIRNNKGKLVSFGRLHSLILRFRGSDYPILGIASILSIEKKKGYGRLVLQAMKNFVHEKKMTAIGFCDSQDTGFYIKCGLGVFEGMERFIFPTGPKSSRPGNTIYIDGDDGLIEKLKKHSKEKITSLRSEW